MQLVPQHDYFVCEFCGSFEFPDDTPPTVDGVRSLGAQTEFACPVCAITLGLGSVEKIHVWHCEQCRGMMVRNDDLANIIRARRAKYTGPPAEQTPLKPAELRRRLCCPVCQQLMNVHPYYGPGNVAIDTCSNCWVVWLDHGELAMIEKAPGQS